MTTYEKLQPGNPFRDDGSDDTYLGPQHDLAPRRPGWTARYLPCAVATSLAAGLFSIAASALVMYLAMSTWGPTARDGGDKKLVLDCGADHASAVANGCILDVFANAWVPAACHDPVAAAEAMLPGTTLAKLDAAGPYQWYADSNHTRPLSYDDLTRLESRHAYTLKGWHIGHCLYEWRSAVKAVNRVLRGERPVYVRHKVISEEHMAHCQQVVAQQIIKGPKDDEASFGLASCVRIDGDLGMLGRVARLV